VNIRFLVLLIALSAFAIVPAFSQESSKASKSPQATAAPAAPKGTSNVTASGLPDEKNLLIGAPAGTAIGSAKPVKSLGAWDYIQMVLVLALVIAGIYLLFYFLKRAGGPKHQENSLIGVLSTKVLQPNRAIHLVDVGGQLYLVGTSENSVNLVSAIEDKEAVDEIRLRAAQSGSHADRKSFRDVFSGTFRKGGGFGFAGSVMDSMGFIKQQRERLKKM